MRYCDHRRHSLPCVCSQAMYVMGRVCVCVYNCYSDDVIQHESCLRFFGYDLRVFTIIEFHFMCQRAGEGRRGVTVKMDRVRKKMQSSGVRANGDRVDKQERCEGHEQRVDRGVWKNRNLGQRRRTEDKGQRQRHVGGHKRKKVLRPTSLSLLNVSVGRVNLTISWGQAPKKQRTQRGQQLI